MKLNKVHQGHDTCKRTMIRTVESFNHHTMLQVKHYTGKGHLLYSQMQGFNGSTKRRKLSKDPLRYYFLELREETESSPYLGY